MDAPRWQLDARVAQGTCAPARIRHGQRRAARPGVCRDEHAACATPHVACVYPVCTCRLLRSFLQCLLTFASQSAAARRLLASTRTLPRPVSVPQPLSQCLSVSVSQSLNPCPSCRLSLWPCKARRDSAACTSPRSLLAPCVTCVMSLLAPSVMSLLAPAWHALLAQTTSCTLPCCCLNLSLLSNGVLFVHECSCTSVCVEGEGKGSQGRGGLTSKRELEIGTSAIIRVVAKQFLDQRLALTRAPDTAPRQRMRRTSTRVRTSRRSGGLASTKTNVSFASTKTNVPTLART